MRAWDRALLEEEGDCITIVERGHPYNFTDSQSFSGEKYIREETLGQYFYATNPRKTRNNCHENKTHMALNMIADLHSSSEF